jgi:hypothetical protein
MLLPRHSINLPPSTSASWLNLASNRRGHLMKPDEDDTCWRAPRRRACWGNQPAGQPVSCTLG